MNPIRLRSEAIRIWQSVALDFVFHLATPGWFLAKRKSICAGSIALAKARRHSTG